MVKPGYKQTDVGVIPEDWDIVQIGDLKPFVTSGSRGWASYYSQHGSLFVRITNLSRESIYLDLTDTKFVKLPPEASEGVRTQLKEHDVLISITADIGIVGYVDSSVSIPAYINQHIALVRLAPTQVNGKFVSYFLASEKPQRLFRATTDIGAKAGMSLITVQKIQTALPPLPEQQAIATALSDADELIGSLERLLTKKRQIKNGAMQELLTGKKRLPGFSGEWQFKKLGEIADVTGSGVDKKVHADETPVRLVNYMDVYRRDFIRSEILDHWVTAPSHKHKRCAVRKGDIFFTPSSETRDDIAHSAVAMEDIDDAVYSYHVVRLRLIEEWDLKFRAYAFKTHDFMSQAETICDGGGTRYVISLGKFREMTIKVPSLTEQTAIAEVLSDMDAEIEALETKLTKARQVKQGMMQELLTGRIRLV